MKKAIDKNIFDLSDIKQNYKEDIKLEKVKKWASEIVKYLSDKVPE